MTWDRTWEEVYRAGRQLNRYPTEQFVQCLAKYYYHTTDRKSVRMLDLGCGAGNNTWYAAREGFSVHAIDGSATAIEYLKKRLSTEGLAADLRVGDLAPLPYQDNLFDFALDRGSIQHNPLEHARRIASEVIRVMKPGGRLLTITHGDSCTDRGFGMEFEPKTYRQISVGTFAGLECVRFYSLDELRELFKPLRLLTALREYREDVMPTDGHVTERWIVTFEKPDDHH